MIADCLQMSLIMFKLLSPCTYTSLPCSCSLLLVSPQAILRVLPGWWRQSRESVNSQTLLILYLYTLTRYSNLYFNLIIRFNS